ncbi:MAG TPA: glycosyltransferase family 1 protein [Thermoflexus sp.]|nr:glycosyltransferase family 1 protein [Thermoflexus sp.]
MEGSPTVRKRALPMLVFDGRVINDRFPGIGRYAYRLLEGMLALEPGLEVRLLHTPALPNRRWDLERLARAPGLRLVSIPVPPFHPAEHLIVPWVLRRWPEAIVHIPHYAVPLGLLAGPHRLAVTLMDLAPLHLPEAWPPLQRGIYRLWHRLVLARAQVVFTLSEATRADLRRWFGSLRPPVVVTPAAADASYGPQPPEHGTAVLRRYGLQSPYALYVGINKPSKNLGRLLEAWRRVREHLGPGWASALLVLVGPWDPRYPLTFGEGVRHLGMVPEEDLPALYAGARLFVFPSLWEGFGLPVLEAMACGVPVACSDIPALREVAGEAAQYFDPQDVDAMARAIAEAWERAGDPAWRAACRARAARFSWEETARRTLEAYRLLMGA